MAKRGGQGRWSGARESDAYALAARQHGVVSRDQLLALGASEQTIRSRRRGQKWIRMLPGVFRLLPPLKSEWHTTLMAACLWVGEGAYVSHASAAALHRLDGFGFAEGCELHVTVCRPHDGRGDDRYGLRVHRCPGTPQDAVTRVDGVPVAQPWWALLQVAGSANEDDVDSALDCALRRRMTTVKDLQRRLEQVRRRGVAGVTVLERLVYDRVGSRPKDSELERWFFKHLVEPYGLPKPVHNFPVYGPDGRLVAKVDAAYPEFGIAIELNGKKDHSAQRSVQKDTARQNLLVLAGLTPLVFWWKDVKYEPRRVAEQIFSAIGRAQAASSAW